MRIRKILYVGKEEAPLEILKEHFNANFKKVDNEINAYKEIFSQQYSGIFMSSLRISSNKEELQDYNAGYRIINLSKKVKNIPIIVYTGSIEKEIVKKKCEELGVEGILFKPESISKALDQIKNIFRLEN